MGLACSTFNPFIYALFSEKFRARIRQICPRVAYSASSWLSEKRKTFTRYLTSRHHDAGASPTKATSLAAASNGGVGGDDGGVGDASAPPRKSTK